MAGVSIYKLVDMVDTYFRKLTIEYCKEIDMLDESIRPKKTPKIVEKFKDGVSRKVVERCYSQVREIFKSSYIFIPDKITLALIRNVHSDDAIDSENDLKGFYEKYVLPMEDENMELNEAQHIFLATAIIVFIKYEEFFKAVYINNSSSDKVVPRIEHKPYKHSNLDNLYRNDTLNAIHVQFEFIMNEVEYEYSKNRFAKEIDAINYWENEINFKFIDEAIYKAMCNAGDINDYIYFHDEYGNIIGKEKIKRQTHWNFSSRVFGKIFYRSVLKVYEDKLEYNEYEAKIDNISDMLSKLPYGLKMDILSKHVKIIDLIHKECLDAENEMRRKSQYSYPQFDEMDARRLSTEETEEYRKYREVKEVYAKKLEAKLTKRIQRIINTDSQEEKERLIQEFVSQVNTIMLLP